MKYYKMKFGTVEKDLPICRITDDLYIAGFVMLGDAPLSEECAKQLLAKAPEYDYILTAEAKGITLANEMARLHGDRCYMIARKYPKLYMTGVFEVTVRSITTDKEQKLYLDTADAEKMKGKRVLIVDDVISTGESLRALETLVEQVGASIVGKMAVLAEGAAADRDDIIYLQRLPLFNADGTVKK
ncbi:MAG: adenine phosphoribosyltransferase [Ruminococcaceae bacterium]|nr:adenine phosphoribosyltransferase [Oscillospiraceae bacterium]